MRDLWQIIDLRKNLGIMLIVWSFASFAFFMVPFYLKNIKVDVYHITLASESAEFVASIFCAFVAQIMPLGRSMIMSCVLIVIGSMSLIFLFSFANIDSLQILACCLVIITNFGVVAFFDIAYLIVPELFPTLLLSTAYGCCNILGRLITIGSPIVADI